MRQTSAMYFRLSQALEDSTALLRHCETGQG